MKNLNYILLVIVLFIGCERNINDSITGENTINPFENIDKVPVSPNYYIAYTFVCEDSTGKDKLNWALADYHTPTQYEIIDDSVYYSCFSPDKKKLLVERKSVIPMVMREFQFGIYDLETHCLDLFYEVNPEFNSKKLPCIGIHPVWAKDQKGFYFINKEDEPIILPHKLFYYDFLTQSRVLIRGSGSQSVIPIGIKGQDTLIVSVTETYQEKKPEFYFMNSQGYYLSKINNPYLEQANLYEVQWNDDLDLFLFSEESNNQTTLGSGICITDLEGKFFQRYTKGDRYFDEYPIWGPGQNVLFRRRNIMDVGAKGAEIMQLDIISGQVISYLKPEDINAKTIVYLTF